MLRWVNPAQPRQYISQYRIPGVTAPGNKKEIMRKKLELCKKIAELGHDFGVGRGSFIWKMIDGEYKYLLVGAEECISVDFRKDNFVVCPDIEQLKDDICNIYRDIGMKTDSDNALLPVLIGSSLDYKSNEYMAVVGFSPKDSHDSVGEPIFINPIRMFYKSEWEAFAAILCKLLENNK